MCVSRGRTRRVTDECPSAVPAMPSGFLTSAFTPELRDQRLPLLSCRKGVEGLGQMLVVVLSQPRPFNV